MPLRVGLVVPHIFMHDAILPHVLFSPGALALDLADGMVQEGVDVTLFTPGPVTTRARNDTADLSLFERELELRGDTYVDLLKKHPFTFITLARQVQSEIIAKAFAAANRNEIDVVHIYTNEEDIALPFADLCARPVVFTHHDPFNFLVKYKNVFPKYKHLNWLSMSYAQRAGMPEDTNWLANIYHGLTADEYTPDYGPKDDYVLFMGRIIAPKGLHLAIDAVRAYNATHNKKYALKIAGKHYAGAKDTYWQESILPRIDGTEIEYVGYIKDTDEKSALVAGAKALLVPSVFEEPFGMVSIEALACGTPVIGLNSGAIPEIIKDGQTGFVVPKQPKSEQGSDSSGLDETAVIALLSDALNRIDSIDPHNCRKDFEERFTLDRMVREHIAAYTTALQNN